MGTHPGETETKDSNKNSFKNFTKTGALASGSFQSSEGRRPPGRKSCMCRMWGGVPCRGARDSLGGRSPLGSVSENYKAYPLGREAASREGTGQLCSPKPAPTKQGGGREGDEAEEAERD